MEINFTKEQLKHFIMYTMKSIKKLLTMIYTLLNKISNPECLFIHGKILLMEEMID